MSEIQRPGALYQQVAAAIREAILSGEFAPDAMLPSEAQLMARYGVSHPPSATRLPPCARKG
jgi:GntR family transcriptional regulator